MSREAVVGCLYPCEGMVVWARGVGVRKLALKVFGDLVSGLGGGVQWWG